MGATREEVERLAAIVTLIAESMGIDLDEASAPPVPAPEEAAQTAADEPEKDPAPATDSADDSGPPPVAPEDSAESAPGPVPGEPETASETTEVETR